MSEKRGSQKVTSAALEMGRLVRLAASPTVPGEQVSHAISRAARRLGFTRGRVASFWYGKARGPSPEELETARIVAVQHAKDLELLRNEHRRALDILARLETRLAVVDPDFNQPGMAALRNVASREAGPGDVPGLTDDAPGDGGA